MPKLLNMLREKFQPDVLPRNFAAEEWLQASNTGVPNCIHVPQSQIEKQKTTCGSTGTSKFCSHFSISKSVMLLGSWSSFFLFIFIRALCTVTIFFMIGLETATKLHETLSDLLSWAEPFLSFLPRICKLPPLGCNLLKRLSYYLCCACTTVPCTFCLCIW